MVLRSGGGEPRRPPGPGSVASSTASQVAAQQMDPARLLLLHRLHHLHHIRRLHCRLRSLERAFAASQVAARQNNPTAKVEAEMSRVRKGWEAAEHRAIDLKVELLRTQVEARTLRASLLTLEVEAEQARGDAEQLQARLDQLKEAIPAAESAAVAAREAQAVAEARRDELNMNMQVLTAERDRALDEAAQVRGGRRSLGWGRAGPGQKP